MWALELYFTRLTGDAVGSMTSTSIRNGLLMGVFLFATTEPQLNFGPEAQESHLTRGTGKQSRYVSCIYIYRNV